MHAIYADGGVIGANPSSVGGTWAWCCIDTNGTRVDENTGLLLPADAGGPVTNNVTELLALVEALEFLPYGWTGTVYSDSQVSLLRVFRAGSLRNVPAWLVTRLQDVQRSGKLKAMQYVLLDGHPTRAHLAAGVGKRGHPCSIHNVWCDQACRRAGRRHVTALRESAVLV